MAGATSSWGDPDYSIFTGGTPSVEPDAFPDENIPPADPVTVDAVDRMRRASAAFMAAYGQFFANQADAAAAGLGDEWAALNDRALTAQSYISQVAAAVQGAWGWTKSVFGLSGLNFLPAIPIAYAVLAAAIAWVVSITADMIRFNQKLSAVKAGTAPGSILTNDATVTGDIASIIKWGVVGLAVFTVLPMFTNSRGKR